MPEQLPSAEEAVATLRHDLRTPLNQIIGYAELVAEDLGEDAQTGLRQDLEKISRAAHGLADLIAREIQPGRVTVAGAPRVSVQPPKSPVAAERLAPSPLPPLASHPSTAPAKILIVDDEPENCAVLRRRLEKEGHYCVPVHDGETVLERLAAEAFDLVLLDIIMPGIDGREVLRRIKRDEKLRHLPVIMISALDQTERVAECVELGAEDYLTKPFNPVLLRARLGASLERKRLRDAERASFAALKESQGKLAAELAEAASYVQSVLPAPISQGPVRASWQFHPSSSLGGDAFGYGPGPDGKFGACLLDVCGHGVGAALLSISVLNVMRAESLPGVNFFDPGEILAGLNSAFPMEKHGEMFFTAWCGIYDPASRRLRFAAGGHPPAVLVRSDGSTELLAAKGPVVGACPGVKFTTCEVEIPPDARVFVFSDGAFEIQLREGRMMSHGDLRALLGRSPQENAPAWIMEQLRMLNSQPVFDDDISLMELFFP